MKDQDISEVMHHRGIEDRVAGIQLIDGIPEPFRTSRVSEDAEMDGLPADVGIQETDVVPNRRRHGHEEKEDEGSETEEYSGRSGVRHRSSDGRER